VARQENTLTLITTSKGVVRMRMIDRINIDDMMLHLIRRETYRLATKLDQGIDISSAFKDFLLTNRFSSGR
jgi:hypothetical protein